MALSGLLFLNSDSMFITFCDRKMSMFYPSDKAVIRVILPFLTVSGYK